LKKSKINFSKRTMSV